MLSPSKTMFIYCKVTIKYIVVRKRSSWPRCPVLNVHRGLNRRQGSTVGPFESLKTEKRAHVGLKFTVGTRRVSIIFTDHGMPLIISLICSHLLYVTRDFISWVFYQFKFLLLLLLIKRNISTTCYILDQDWFQTNPP